MPTAHPEHAGTAPVLTEHPPAYATEKWRGKKSIYESGIMSNTHL